MKFISYSISILMLLLSGSRNLLSELPADMHRQFLYNYKNELVYNDQQGVEINPLIESIAINLNKHLNQSILFDSSLLRDVKKTRSHHARLKPAKEFVGQNFDVFTDDGVRLGATYFDRGSDSLLIIASGFTNERELMSPFVSMFPNYDIVLFDFRGHGYRPFEWTDSDTWPLSLTKASFGIDGNLVRFGHEEDKDVYAVVDAFKRIKQHNTGAGYKNVYGLGLCIGAFILVKTQALHGLFDKLILDSCWLSLEEYIDKIRNDFYILFDPQKGGWKEHSVLSHPLVVSTIESFVRTFFLTLKDITLVDYAPLITNTPILMFYGKDDYTVSRNEFERLWQLFAVPEKTAIITTNEHVRNHLKQKELYKLASDLFFENTQNNFIKLLTDEKELTQYYARKIIDLAI